MKFHKIAFLIAIIMLAPLIVSIILRWNEINWNNLISLFIYLAIGAIIDNVSCRPFQGEGNGLRVFSTVVGAYLWPLYIAILIPVVAKYDYDDCRITYHFNIKFWQALVLVCICNTRLCDWLAKRWGVPEDKQFG